LRGYSKLRKRDLIQLIAEARAPVYQERVVRALQTGRYPALRGDIDNPHKKAQRIRELGQLQDEVTATLRAHKYAQEIMSNPRKRLEILRKAHKRVMRHGFRKESLARAITQKGEQLLQEIIPKDSEEKGRRVITWKLFRNLAGSVVDRIMTKVEVLQTSFYLRFGFTCQLRHIENGNVMLWEQNLGGSPTLLTTHAAAREWLQKKDDIRLDRVNPPNTKWVFQRWVQVEVKAILVDQPLLGQGPLPDWLRNKKGLCALDTFNDNLCLFRCVAVHRGARPDRCTEKAIELAKHFWVKTNNEQVKFLRAVEYTELKKVEETFKLGIRVYEPSEDGTWRLIRQPAHYEAVGIEPMTIGWYGDHAFLIKDIKK